MQATDNYVSAKYANIANRALLPEQIGIEWSCWWYGRLDETGWLVNYLRNEEFSWKPLQDATNMIAWNIESMFWDFSLISPEEFLQNPVIIQPPEWINLHRWQEWKGHVQEIQRIVHAIVEKNNKHWLNPCLTAVVHDRKVKSVQGHVEAAGFTKITQYWANHLFVHNTTIKVAEKAYKALGLNK